MTRSTRRICLVRPDGFLPKERYTTAEFADLELERLWPRVWQIAGREEELAAPGDFLEYAIGDESIVVVRTEARRARRLPQRVPAPRARVSPTGCGAFADGEIRCPYHAWTYALDGRLVRRARPRGVRRPARRSRAARRCASSRWGGFVFVNMDLDAEPLLDFLDPLPDAARAVPLRRAALPHVPLDDHRRELEGRRRRVQRELPRAGPARADPAVDRRHEHRVRAVRTALALRPAARRAPRAAAEPAPRSRSPTTTTRARSSARSSPGSAARSSARSATRSPSCARRGRRRVRRCSARTRSGA